MPFHHEKLTVYQRALEFASWSPDLIESLTKKTSTRDHLERSGDSIALNIAEGNGKFSKKDRARFFLDRARLRFGVSGVSRSPCCAALLSPRRDCKRKGNIGGDRKDAFHNARAIGCRIAEDSREYGEIADEEEEVEED
jgi:hypothetical protein